MFLKKKCVGGSDLGGKWGGVSPGGEGLSLPALSRERGVTRTVACVGKRALWLPYIYSIYMLVYDIHFSAWLLFPVFGAGVPHIAFVRTGSSSCSTSAL